MTDTLEYALRYASQGWAVFPVHGIVEGCCTCGQRDCTSPGKHPVLPGGFKIASKEPKKIRQWWSVEPRHNIAIATGTVSGLLVVDVDLGPKKEGEASLRGLEDEVGPLPRNVVVLTGGGGFHIYLQMPNQPIRSSAGKIGVNLDVRADGGYVVAPPSTHISGFNYEWSVSL
ncbi:Bifunctional DNA primase/polymerase, N-terminal [Sulfitobacter brevis]|uniref:Bifunctional DNA primase/polymerase, N-terminal n=1 Tax=Sulfitobacter brevis TaxID=74348 RepID=A0A1I2HDM2_9RHOB|nr:bifunctional DNA primase/polymerase [Sulfitobacter brevis]SFF27658.1 Bifunctional DNA primase/polymerase, N-terminal [Sulfitobacter brevis]